MTNHIDIYEKREQDRFKVVDGAFAVFPGNPPKLASIKEISGGGLTVLYFNDHESSDETSELDILFSDSDFRLRRVSYQTTSNFEIGIELSESLVEMRQQGLKFGDLTTNQKSQLDYFIQNYTSMV